MWIKYPTSISAEEKTAVKAAIDAAVQSNKDLTSCKVIVSRSLRDHIDHGRVINENVPGWAINFYKRLKTLHI